MGVYAVTGGSHGIGAKTVELLKKEGHEVINIDLLKADITADLVTPEGRQKVVDELHAMHPEGLDGLILSAAGCAATLPPTRQTASASTQSLRETWEAP